MNTLERTIFSFIASKKLRLIVAGGCNSCRHQRFMQQKFFKIEISEKNSQYQTDQWKIGKRWFTSNWKVLDEKQI